MANLINWRIENNYARDKAKLDYILDNIKRHSRNPCKLLDTHEGYHSITFVTIFNYYYRFKFENANIDDLFLSKDPLFYEHLCKIFVHLANTRNNWMRKQTRPFRHDKIETNTSHDERQRFIFSTLLRNFNYLLGISEGIRQVLNRLESINVFLTILVDENLEQNIEQDVFENIVLDVASLTKHAHSNKFDWQKLKAVDVFLRFLNSHPKFDLEIYTMIAKVATDKEIEEGLDFPGIVSDLVRLINTKEFSQVCKMKFYDDDLRISIETNMISYYHDEKKCRIPITTLLNILYHFSINDQFKWDLYRQMKGSTLKKFFLKNPNEVIKEHTAQILAQLCFNKRVLEDVMKDKEFCGCISELAHDEKIAWKKLTKICQLICEFIEDQSSEDKSENSKPLFDFMISYCSGSRDFSLKLKRTLESLHFKVFIDSEADSHSNPLKIADAIQSSKQVLVCVNEMYRQSAICRWQVEYAIKIKRDIIPMIIQKGYDQVDGWLGSIVRSRDFVDFHQDDTFVLKYESGIKELTKLVRGKENKLEIKPRKFIEASAKPKPVLPVSEENVQDLRKNENPTDKNSAMHDFISNLKLQEPVSSPKDIRRKEIESWNQEKVSKWLNEQNVDKSIVDFLGQCNGDYLSQLNKLQLYSPEYFYQIVNHIQNISSPTSFINFSIALKQLFE